jgi:hypothetical protein
VVSKSTLARNLSIPKAVLVLLSLVLAGVVFTGWPSPAEAETTFSVNKTGGAKDRKVGDGKCDTSRLNGMQCSLRAAIQEANATANSGGPDEINFAIGGTASVKTISPASELPTITDPVIINGYTQGSTTATTSDDAKENTLAEGNDAVLKVQLNGAKAGSASGLVIGASDCTVKGLVINRFGLDGIRISGSGAQNNKVEGNFIGTDATGSVDLGNSNAGVYIFRVSNNTVGGTEPGARNVISGNGGGVHMFGSAATGNKVMGNFIGTNAAGTAALGNGNVGVGVSGPTNTVGGTLSGARNVISGNLSYGVAIGDSGNKVEGNYIGTDAEGSADLGNALGGVFIQGSNNTIGGTTSEARNVISGNDEDGVFIRFDSTGNKVEGNYIGTDAEGSADLGNSRDGVVLYGFPHDNIIGGTASGAANVISGNGDDGVYIFRAENNRVERNFIGTGKNGNGDVGNSGAGVEIEFANDNIIGGAASQTHKGNTIAFNGGDGIRVWDDSTGNRLLTNSIFSNDELGIDLSGGTEDSFGVSANDVDFNGSTDDSDTGNNNLQNFPVITSATQDPDGVNLANVDVVLNSTPNQTFLLQFFDSEADPSGHGEGYLYGSQTTTTTDANGNASFTFRTSNVLAGSTITATATNTATGDTSEFSPNVVVGGG